jgi:hypothetical protein
MPKRSNQTGHSADYDVGYAKPPEAFRFKNGVSGNPSGRKPKLKRKAYGSGLLSEAIQRELKRKIKVRDGDRVRILTGAEAIAYKMVRSAITGAGSASNAILKLEAQHPEPLPAQTGPVRVTLKLGEEPLSYGGSNIDNSDQ